MTDTIPKEDDETLFRNDDDYDDHQKGDKSNNEQSLDRNEYEQNACKKGTERNANNDEFAGENEQYSDLGDVRDIQGSENRYLSDSEDEDMESIKLDKSFHNLLIHESPRSLCLVCWHPLVSRNLLNLHFCQDIHHLLLEEMMIS